MSITSSIESISSRIKSISKSYPSRKASFKFKNDIISNSSRSISEDLDDDKTTSKIKSYETVDRYYSDTFEPDTKHTTKYSSRKSYDYTESFESLTTVNDKDQSKKDELAEL